MSPAWRSRIRRLALWCGGLVMLYAVVGFLVAPPIVRYQLERVLSEKLGRQVTVESVRINPFALTVSIRNFSLKDPDGSKTAVGFEELNVNLTLSSFVRGGLIVEAVDLVKPYVRVVRLADGTYSFQDMVARLTSGPPSPPGPAPRFALYNIQVHDGRIEFDDRPEKAQHSVAGLQIGVPFISSLPAEIDIRVAPRLSAKVNGTPFEIAGETTPFKDRSVTTVRVDFDELDVAKYLRYSPVPLRIRVPSGKLSTRLVLSSTSVPGNPVSTLTVSGTARLERLRVQHADGAPLFALARLGLDLGGIELLKRRALITGLRIDAPELNVTRGKDGNLDLLAALPATAPTRSPKPKEPGNEKPFTYMIEQIALSNGKLRFVDRTPDKPVTLDLSELSVYVEGLGNTAENNALVKVRGRLAGAPLEIGGKLAQLPQGLALDLQANARDIDLTPFSPYSILYVGHGIEKGKLSLKHAFVIHDRQLDARNNIRLDQFTFGDKVDSPAATSLPVTFAVSLLKDENGVIDVDVPVSGSLDDPQVNIREAIASAFRSSAEKAASSPFALLGAQFGAGEELAYLEFIPGSAALEAESLQKLKTLATALAARPGLRLDVSGRVDPNIDGTEIELRSLADSRAQAARSWLVESGKVSADRIAVVAAKMSADDIKDKGKPTRVDFALR